MSKTYEDASKEMREFRDSAPRVGLPPNPLGQNDDRADWAGEALISFMQETGTDAPDAMSDLLADMMHFCDRQGTSFEDELSRAREHYKEETAQPTNK